MLDITSQKAQRGLVDFGRIEEMLSRIGSRIDHRVLEKLTPLAAPLFLEAGRGPVKGDAEERLLAQEAARLMEASGLANITPAPSNTPRWRVGW